MIFSIGDHKPQIHPSAFVHPTAEISGNVKIGPRASIWGGCILRGDIDLIDVGEDSNVQDRCVFHTSMHMPVILEKGVTVGHCAIIHGARVKRYSLIGMGAALLDRSVIEENCFVAAGAVVKEGAVIPKNSLAVGIPARVARLVKPEETKLIVDRAGEYVALAKQYQAALQRAGLA
jgi:carbonic anhydrase/acetyltransferase-like protein (isoleucine patch superfamily)